MSHALELIPARPAPPIARPAMTPARAFGYGALGLWLLLAVALAYMMISGWDTEKFVKYGPRYLEGLATTLALVASSITLGALLSVPIAYGACRKTSSSTPSPMRMSTSFAAHRCSPRST